MSRAKKRQQFQWLHSHRLAQYQRAFDTGDPAYIAERWAKLKETENRRKRRPHAAG
ncbi:MAG: hypothetical protein Q8O40_15165 [Chloroflexota bacterium]|nr:hypothetical protein [Chloroflexota bacterium]